MVGFEERQQMLTRNSKNGESTSFDLFSSMRGFLFLATVIVLIWGLTFLWMPYFFPDGTDGENRTGAAGDMFGGVTALFSGLAFAGLVSTLFMQRKELELQRLELRQTRTVFETQKFENTFFGLVKLLGEQLDGVHLEFEDPDKTKRFKDPRSRSSTITGRAALDAFVASLPKPFGATNETQRASEMNSLFQGYDELHEVLYESNIERAIELLLLAVDHVDAYSEKMRDDQFHVLYIDILRSQIDGPFLYILMFHGITGKTPGIKEIIEKYSLLRTLRIDHDPEHPFLELYAYDAFRKLPQKARH